MKMIKLPSHAVLVMDKGYLNYSIMKQWTDKRITWVSRLNEGAIYEVTQKRSISKQQLKNGVRKDMEILLGLPSTKKKRPLQQARIVRFYDKPNKRTFNFLTNNFDYSPLTIANIYHQRWKVETLFQRVKYNFQFHNFLGDNENAIKIQMWCTLIADLLINIIKDKVDRIRKHKWSFANIAGMIRLHLSTYINLFKFLINPERAVLQYNNEMVSTQLNLFKT
jgi:IS4 transposase